LLEKSTPFPKPMSLAFAKRKKTLDFGYSSGHVRKLHCTSKRYNKLEISSQMLSVYCPPNKCIFSSFRNAK
jgi:hypothetical protein